ncbi:MAG: hypothetical protein QW270_05525 [Candidatus Bathyarchaeia archaeon]
MARVSIFKGREARVNKAIFWILAMQSPLTIYDIWRRLRTQRDFQYIRYHIVNRRVRTLKEQGFIEKIGERKTKNGFQATLYQLTLRAYLSILLDKLDMDFFLKKASSDEILSMLVILASQQQS